MFLKQLFKTPSALQIATKNIEDAQRSLLTAQAAAEYNNKLAEYYQGMITRLSQYIKEETQPN